MASGCTVFPHTNYNVFTIGCYLNDTGLEDGPLAVMPGSHQGELYNLYHGETWAGCLTDEDAAHCQWKMPNISQGERDRSPSTIAGPFIFSSEQVSEPRPLLLNCYTSADAKPYTPHPDPSSHAFELVRGNPVRGPSMIRGLPHSSRLVRRLQFHFCSAGWRGFLNRACFVQDFETLE